MANPADSGQPPRGERWRAALATVADGLAELPRRGWLDVEPLLDAYRALGPVGHPGAAAPSLDTGFLAGAVSFGGLSLLRASHLVVTRGAPRAGPYLVPSSEGDAVELRAPPAPDAPYDAVALVAGLALEARKLEDVLGARALDDAAPTILARTSGADEETLAAQLGGDAAHARRVLGALLEGGVHRTVHLGLGAARPDACPAVDPVLLDAAAHDTGGPLFVLAGATERLHDLVSPYARRLRAPLSSLAGASSEDALYDALPLLYAEEPRALDERLEVETRAGLSSAGAALVARFDAMDPALADPRARESLRALKRSRARAVLCGRHPDTLSMVLASVGTRARAVIVLGEGFCGEAPALHPDLVRDARTGHLVEIDNALSSSKEAPSCVVTSAPSLGLVPLEGMPADTSSFSLLTAALSLRALGQLTKKTRLAAAVARIGDGEALSQVALLCLARMAATQEQAEAAPRRRGR